LIVSDNFSKMGKSEFIDAAEGEPYRLGSCYEDNDEEEEKPVRGSLVLGLDAPIQSCKGCLDVIGEDGDDFIQQSNTLITDVEIDSMVPETAVPGII
jgi:hypothetical protein